MGKNSFFKILTKWHWSCAAAPSLISVDKRNALLTFHNSSTHRQICLPPVPVPVHSDEYYQSDTPLHYLL